MLGGFTTRETAGGAPGAESTLWRRGGACLGRSSPRPKRTASSGGASTSAPCFERDFPQWGVRAPAATMGRFWAMLAHYHAQTWNAAAPARGAWREPGGGAALSGCSHRCADGTPVAAVVRQPEEAASEGTEDLRPRLRPLHRLLGIDTENGAHDPSRDRHVLGGFAIEQVLASEPHDDAFFWSTHQGAEIDLILRRNGALYGVECKRADAPRITPSIRTSLTDVGLARVTILYPGPQRFPLSEQVEVVPLAILARGEPLFA